MEYTDCDNCTYLEAQNADLITANEEFLEEIAYLKELIQNTVDELSEI